MQDVFVIELLPYFCINFYPNSSILFWLAVSLTLPFLELEMALTSGPMRAASSTPIMAR